MKLLVLDNYDSFTYNLVQYIQELLDAKVEVVRNDAIELSAVAEYDVVVLSPGPGLPSQAGIMPELIKKYASEKFILGVCLGHQAIGEAFGAGLENLSQVYHGVSTPIQIIDPEDILFADIPRQIEVGRYHSWVVNKNSLPETLKVTAMDSQGEIMALRHRMYEVYGVQFHPESIMTTKGMQILENFLAHCAKTLKSTVEL